MILQANSSHLFLWQLTEFVSLLIFYRGPERSWVKLIIFSVFPRQQICFVFTQCHEWITTLSRNNKCCLFWNSDRLFSRPQGNKLSVIFPKQRDNPSRENNLLRRTRACAHTHTHTHTVRVSKQTMWPLYELLHFQCFSFWFDRSVTILSVCSCLWCLVWPFSSVTFSLQYSCAPSPAWFSLLTCLLSI